MNADGPLMPEGRKNESPLSVRRELNRNTLERGRPNERQRTGLPVDPIAGEIAAYPLPDVKCPSTRIDHEKRRTAGEPNVRSPRDHTCLRVHRECANPVLVLAGHVSVID